MSCDALTFLRHFSQPIFMIAQPIFMIAFSCCKPTELPSRTSLSCHDIDELFLQRNTFLSRCGEDFVCTEYLNIVHLWCLFGVGCHWGFVCSYILSESLLCHSTAVRVAFASCCVGGLYCLCAWSVQLFGNLKCV